MEKYGQYCLNFFHAGDRIAVNTPDRYEIVHVPRPGVFTFGGKLVSWEKALGKDQHMPAGTEKYSVPEGSRLVLVRPGEDPFYFQVPLRPAQQQRVEYAQPVAALPWLVIFLFVRLMNVFFLACLLSYSRSRRSMAMGHTYSSSAPLILSVLLSCHKGSSQNFWPRAPMSIDSVRSLAGRCNSETQAMMMICRCSTFTRARQPGHLSPRDIESG